MRRTLLLVLPLLCAAFPAPARDRGADGHFDTRTSSHFRLYQDVDIDQSGGFRGSRRFEQQLLDTLENAYESLDHLLGLRPERKLDVMVYDPGLFDRQFAGLFRCQAAGFYHGVIRVRGATELSLPLSTPRFDAKWVWIFRPRGTLPLLVLFVKAPPLPALVLEAWRHFSELEQEFQRSL